jgi:DNA replication protein DnaC
LGWRRAAPEAQPGESGFGKLIPCTCNQAAQAQQHRRLQQLLDLPQRLEAWTFESFTVFDEPEPPQGRGSNRAAYAAARAFAKDPAGWLLLTGPVGTGKTHLLAAIAHVCLAQECPVAFATAPDLLDTLRNGYADATFDYQTRLNQLCTLEVLLLDDLGTEKATSWAQEKLFQLLNTRYNAGLPTVVATNLPLRALAPRLRSRLTDQQLVHQVPVLTQDMRPLRRAQSTAEHQEGCDV